MGAALGLAIAEYSAANNGSVLPTAFNTGGEYGNYDYWVAILIAQHYLPDAAIPVSAWKSPSASGRGVTVCPAVRDTLLYSDGAGYSGTATNSEDGFERDQSLILMPASSYEPARAYGLIAETGYGINGLKDVSTGSGNNANYGDVVSNTAVLDKAVIPAWPVKKMGQSKQASEAVMIFDGTYFNAMNTAGTNSITRISGARHGKYDPNRPCDTGITNVLFLDGHAGSVPASLPPH